MEYYDTIASDDKEHQQREWHQRLITRYRDLQGRKLGYLAD
jgi:hypothetical protein